MTFLGARPAHMMIDHAPQSATAHAQQSAGGQDRACSRCDSLEKLQVASFFSVDLRLV